MQLFLIFVVFSNVMCDSDMPAELQPDAQQIIEEASQEAYNYEKRRIAKVRAQGQSMRSFQNEKDVFRHAAPREAEAWTGLKINKDNVFDVEYVEPLHMDSEGTMGVSMGQKGNTHPQQKRYDVVVRGEVLGWDCRGCDEARCVLEYTGAAPPQYTFMGVENDPNALQISQRQVGATKWQFLLDFVLPVKFMAFHKQANLVTLSVEQALMKVKPSESALEFLRIEEISNVRSVITVQVQAGHNIDIKQVENEILLVMHPDADLAQHIPLFSGEAIRGCYVESAAQPILHIMLMPGVKMSDTWLESEGMPGAPTIYKIALSHGAVGGTPVGTSPKLMYDEALRSGPFDDDEPVSEGRAPSETSEWQPISMDAPQLREIRIAQTSDELVGSGGVMAPKWLREAQHAFHEQQRLRATA